MNILKKLTKEYLKMNKKRTLVTIIGIILTGAMISGVTTLAASFQSFMVETQKQDSGDWDACFGRISYSNAKYIENNKNFENIHYTQYISEGLDLKDELMKRSVRVTGYDKAALKNLNINIIEGRYPENTNEILVPQEYLETHTDLKVGDIVDITNTSVIEEGVQPEIKKYTIVGVSNNRRLLYGDLFKTITYFDNAALTDNSIVDISVTAKNTKELYNNCNEVFENLKLYNEEEKSVYFDYNNSLLMYKGVSEQDEFSKMIIAVCAVLIIVIAIGSIIVIYNSFAISVSERKRQFGMLASIGATKKQIKKMVLYEGVIVGAIGIPFGVLSGIFGIYLTLKVVDNLIRDMFATTRIDVHLELSISYVALLIAVILMAITIYLSVFIPAKKASKISPIEAIRGSGEIKIKPRKVKTPKFLRKFYGIEGDMALKNLKRSRRRYRTTVISLTISIVLFLTFNGFVTYMFSGFDAMYTDMPYDYTLSIYGEKNKVVQATNDVLKITGTKRIAAGSSISTMVKLDDSNINPRFKTLLAKNENMQSVFGKVDENPIATTYITNFDDASYKQYLKEAGVKELADGECILVNYIDGIYMFKAEFEVFDYKVNDTINFEIGNEYIDTCQARSLKIKKVTDIAPYGVTTMGGTPFLVVNEKTFNELKSIESGVVYQEDNLNNSIDILVEADDIAKVQEQVDGVMKNYPELNHYGYDVKEQMQLIRNLKLIIQIFLYGFIVLISLIGISNIFNTITTNVNLRRREFANLKSIGMTDKAFNKMMNLECLFYGSKSLLFGLPIGCLMCYLLSKAFSGEVMFIFEIPWSSIAIVILAVYLIVFMTMLYARNKIKKDNIIDVLRNDNI